VSDSQTPNPAPAPLTGTILDYAGHSEEARSAADPNAKPYKEGRAAEHARGVQWIGPWESPDDGFAGHTRASVRALSAAGLQVQLRGLSPRQDVEEQVVDSVRDLLTKSIAKYEVRVVQIVPNLDVVSRWVLHPRLDAQEAAGRNAATILYTVWERENMDRNLVALMSLAGQLWTACSRSAKALVAAGAPADKVHVVPMPYTATDPFAAMAPRRRPGGPLRFLHIGKWEPRKGQDQLIHAFMLAFRPGEAEFIIKTSKQAPEFVGYAKNPTAAVQAALRDPRVAANGWTDATVSPSIRMIRDRLSDTQIVALHSWADVYCTASHGEGFDMPAFASALARNRLVYTPCGGPEDFCNDADVLVQNCGSESCHPWYEWEENSTWTSVATDDVAEALREAARRGRGPVTRSLSSGFSAIGVGRKMRQLIEQQAQTFGVRFNGDGSGT